jgi:hypothetical protein
LAAATSAFIPPHWARLVHVAQFTLLPLELLEVPELLGLLELDELLQAAVSNTVLATTAPAVITCRARTVIVPPRPLPPFGGANPPLLARQVEIMSSQVEREVSGANRAIDRFRTASVRTGKNG